MASTNLIVLFLFLLFVSNVSAQSSHINPFNCSQKIKTCSSILYQHNNLPVDRIATLYSVNTSEIKQINHANQQDYLINVPCSCENVNGTIGYFYDTVYKVQANDTFFNVSSEFYSGSAWKVGGEERSFSLGANVTMHLLCGCVETDTQIVVTYTVQEGDTISDIANLLSAKPDEILKLNPHLGSGAGFIVVGWLLYVPMELNGIPPLEIHEHEQGKKQHKWFIIVGVLSAATFSSMCLVAAILVGRKRLQKQREDKKKTLLNTSIIGSFSTQKPQIHKEQAEDMKVFESERPVVYSLEEIAEATRNFDESRKIGTGGYGCVYFGEIGNQEVAIKKMRSNNSKAFLAELKVLCKIHHINVVELLGYASGDGHLYVVYEYVPNGCLGDHLHNPLLKGRQPLSWAARIQIAVDAAKGIEYIHDHTKAQYVHRDIKTTNILLDEGLRAKVADFGLAKLVGRTNEDDQIATRLVGTPGYLPPESVKELQVTTKTDVFAFGVVLAELITGQRALIRDSRENKMKSLITIIYQLFENDEPEIAMPSIVDTNLQGNYPMEDVYKMAEIAYWCLSEKAVDRPEMREVVMAVTQIQTSSCQWEAFAGGSSTVLSGLLKGR
ncbi:hypothetical protein LIER_01970 [Lithospermum erythrorhizon]|uniref:LysM domain receptor-like kinase 3 n=1 Tax=Lithospermum erythrorhizon TaxID=34254 RepID=A0AAV3NMS5_LITER